MKNFILLIFVFIMFFIFGYIGIHAFTPPTVSIVMSTYNREELLPRAIESILNQTYKDFEFIIIDDGSTNGANELLKRYAKKDRRIKILKNNKNEGLIYSLNKGLDTAKGKYVARMDDDDISLPRRLEMQVQYMDEYPKLTVLGTDFYLNTLGNLRNGGPTNEKEAAIISYIQVPVLHPTVMMRRDFLNKHNIRYNSRFPSAEDTHFWYLIVISGGSIQNLTEPLLIYETNSRKLPGYGVQQVESYKLFLKETLSDFMNTDTFNYPPSYNQTCFILRKMEKAFEQNPQNFENRPSTNIDMTTLKEMLKNKGCP